MRNPDLETKLRDWFEEMVNRYKWLSIKFEYSEERGVYLVSYSPIQKIEENDSFIKDSIEFEDKINMLYGDKAPLFCDEEKYFKLSSEAEVIKYRDCKFFNVDVAKAIVAKAIVVKAIVPNLSKFQQECVPSTNYPFAA